MYHETQIRPINTLNTVKQGNKDIDLSIVQLLIHLYILLCVSYNIVAGHSESIK